ncbi:MAG: hypothetical protein RLZZ308_320 [Candidatus Parcubacteria bacterium]|jgi:hypothetical protein
MSLFAPLLFRKGISHTFVRVLWLSESSQTKPDLYRDTHKGNNRNYYSKLNEFCQKM